MLSRDAERGRSCWGGRGVVGLTGRCNWWRAGAVGAEELLDRWRCPGAALRQGLAQVDHFVAQLAQVEEELFAWSHGLDLGDYAVGQGLDLPETGLDAILLARDPFEGDARFEEAVGKGFGAVQLDE